MGKEGGDGRLGMKMNPWGIAVLFVSGQKKCSETGISQ
jgi:hypothetical protein